jgi:hypothetical protein
MSHCRAAAPPSGKTFGETRTARRQFLCNSDQVPLSFGPVPHGEIGRVIREPAEILRHKAGPYAPVFDAAAVERLQAEIEGETDSLPLLAFPSTGQFSEAELLPDAEFRPSA